MHAFWSRGGRGKKEEEESRRTKEEKKKTGGGGRKGKPEYVYANCMAKRLQL